MYLLGSDAPYLQKYPPEGLGASNSVTHEKCCVMLSHDGFSHA